MYKYTDPNDSLLRKTYASGVHVIDAIKEAKKHLEIRDRKVKIIKVYNLDEHGKKKYDASAV